MVLEIHTKNLNERLYNRMIENILTNLGVNVWNFNRFWKIQLYPLEQTNPKYFDHYVTTSGQKINPNMPSGATGKKVITLWLHDSKDFRKNMENSSRVQHELCHAVLYDKHGTKDGIWVKAVHNERRPVIKTSFWFWSGFPYFWRRMPLSILDIRLLI